MKQLRIDFDTNYGINKRTGWSIAVNGSYLVQLERFLLVAIVKALWTSFRLRPSP